MDPEVKPVRGSERGKGVEESPSLKVSSGRKLRDQQFNGGNTVQRKLGLPPSTLRPNFPPVSQ